ncbi:hypothetical protein [Paraburkholderia aspalathi]|uniref:Uncharacterized protein n=1 Tax=Paraburkholderia aspalathi TaxID=1324617 RepID=A0A1I7CEA9_9BURK|nr:hypothetical protein [Paraburkholderia aspalathi]SFT97785.1 hypothetical protein SAMN05192563_1006166 [Paraburkholderia aspalathi]
MKSTRICLACGNPFEPLLHVPRQRYCSSKACQRARRRDWQTHRLRIDDDYRDNQARAQAKWRAGHSGYWREYRAAHPAYRERNRCMQKTRNAQRNFEPIANMDVIRSQQPLGSGFYVLRGADDAGAANMGAWTVHIAVLSAPAAPPI